MNGYYSIKFFRSTVSKKCDVGEFSFYIRPCVLNSPPRKGGDVTLFRISFHSSCNMSAKQKGIVKYYGSFEN